VVKEVATVASHCTLEGEAKIQGVENVLKHNEADGSVKSPLTQHLEKLKGVVEDAHIWAVKTLTEGRTALASPAAYYEHRWGQYRTEQVSQVFGKDSKLPRDTQIKLFEQAAPVLAKGSLEEAIFAKDNEGQARIRDELLKSGQQTHESLKLQERDIHQKVLLRDAARAAILDDTGLKPEELNTRLANARQLVADRLDFSKQHQDSAWKDVWGLTGLVKPSDSVDLMSPQDAHKYAIGFIQSTRDSLNHMLGVTTQFNTLLPKVSDVMPQFFDGAKAKVDRLKELKTNIEERFDNYMDAHYDYLGTGGLVKTKDGALMGGMQLFDLPNAIARNPVVAAYHIQKSLSDLNNQAYSLTLGNSISNGRTANPELHLFQRIERGADHAQVIRESIREKHFNDGSGSEEQRLANANREIASLSKKDSTGAGRNLGQQVVDEIFNQIHYVKQGDENLTPPGEAHMPSNLVNMLSKSIYGSEDAPQLYHEKDLDFARNVSLTEKAIHRPLSQEEKNTLANELEYRKAQNVVNQKTIDANKEIIKQRIQSMLEAGGDTDTGYLVSRVEKAVRNKNLYLNAEEGMKAHADAKLVGTQRTEKEGKLRGPENKAPDPFGSVGEKDGVEQHHLDNNLFNKDGQGLITSVSLEKLGADLKLKLNHAQKLIPQLYALPGIAHSYGLHLLGHNTHQTLTPENRAIVDKAIEGNYHVALANELTVQYVGNLKEGDIKGKLEQFKVAAEDDALAQQIADHAIENQNDAWKAQAINNSWGQIVVDRLITPIQKFIRANSDKLGENSNKLPRYKAELSLDEKHDSALDFLSSMDMAHVPGQFFKRVREVAGPEAHQNKVDLGFTSDDYETWRTKTLKTLNNHGRFDFQLNENTKVNFYNETLALASLDFEKYGAGLELNSESKKAFTVATAESVMSVGGKAPTKNSKIGSSQLMSGFNLIPNEDDKQKAYRSYQALFTQKGGTPAAKLSIALNDRIVQQMRNNGFSYDPSIHGESEVKSQVARAYQQVVGEKPSKPPKLGLDDYKTSLIKTKEGKYRDMEGSKSKSEAEKHDKRRGIGSKDGFLMRMYNGLRHLKRLGADVSTIRATLAQGAVRGLGVSAVNYALESSKGVRIGGREGKSEIADPQAFFPDNNSFGKTGTIVNHKLLSYRVATLMSQDNQGQERTLNEPVSPQKMRDYVSTALSQLKAEEVAHEGVTYQKVGDVNVFTRGNQPFELPSTNTPLKAAKANYNKLYPKAITHVKGDGGV
jgi:hypothetical protein